MSLLKRHSRADGSVARANELNLFFNRFDTAALAPVGSPADCLQPPPLLTPPPPPDSTSSNLMSPSHPSPTPHTSSGSHATCPPLTLDFNSPPPQPALFTPLHVRRQLSKLPTGKAAGPDGVSPRVLRACAEQLCGVFHRVFNMSLSLQRVPVIWKTCAKDAAAQRSLGLPTGGTDVTYHEDPGETRPGAAQAYGQAAPGSPPGRLPAPDWS
ncbi:uncharacterized protein LOC126383507 [Epinephelus moara]|uniref:uncharacterized protein LOC126383507 n=1 Tax=Epinephelus moara TaxID=300413 RepID=UPI00214F5A50|nr:uncharacterized protein LOC126383507 [Epinephelus moara]